MLCMYMYGWGMQDVCTYVGVRQRVSANPEKMARRPKLVIQDPSERATKKTRQTREGWMDVKSLWQTSIDRYMLIECQKK